MRSQWFLIGVVDSTAVAKEVATLAREAWPDDDLRVFNVVSFERELSTSERERLFDALRHPTEGQKQRLAAFLTIAEARVEAAKVASGQLSATG